MSRLLGPLLDRRPTPNWDSTDHPLRLGETAALTPYSDRDRLDLETLADLVRADEVESTTLSTRRSVVSQGAGRRIFLGSHPITSLSIATDPSSSRLASNTITSPALTIA
jgi:hypothetical protein